MTYTVVPMTYDHVPQAAELERLCFPDPWSEGMLREHLDNQCAAAVAAVGEDGTLLGYAGLLAVLDEGYITNVAVRPGFHRQGIASALLGVFLRFGEAGHLAFLTLEVRASNAAARALYDSLGFRAAGRRRNYYEHPREDAIIMTKEFTHGTEAADEGTAAGGL